MWVGLKKDETENKWKGFKGDEKKDLSSHKAWAPGVPDNYNGIGENCGEIQNFGGDYLSDLGMQKPGIAFVPSWNDAHCDKRNFFICEASLETAGKSLPDACDSALALNISTFTLLISTFAIFLVL